MVSLRGEIDLAVRDEIERQLADGAAAAVAGECDLYVDLGAVTFIDSTGLACVVRTAAALEASGRRLQLCNVPPIVLRLLELTGLSELIKPLP